jgi:hypothetical protein
VTPAQPSWLFATACHAMHEVSVRLLLVHLYALRDHRRAGRLGDSMRDSAFAMIVRLGAARNTSAATSVRDGVLVAARTQRITTDQRNVRIIR